MNTGCLKIFKRAEGFDKENKFIPLEKRGTDIQLFRGKGKTSIETESCQIIEYTETGVSSHMFQKMLKREIFFGKKK